MTDQAAVSVKNLSGGYEKRQILKDISFEIPGRADRHDSRGRMREKHHLRKHMIGLYRPSSGDVLMHGKSIVHADESEKSRIMRSFGVAYQGGALFRALTLGENIALPLEEYTTLTPGEIRDKIQDKLKLVHLDGYQDYMPSDLSGGMIKRAAFARALALIRIFCFRRASRRSGPSEFGPPGRLISRHPGNRARHRRRHP